MSNRNPFQTINSEATLIENKSIHDLKEESAPINPNVNQKEIARIDEKLSKRKAKQLRRALAASKKVAESELADQQSSEIAAKVDGLGVDTFEKKEEELAEIKVEEVEMIAEEKADVVGTDKLSKKEVSNFEAEETVQEMIGKVSAPELQIAAVVPSDEDKVTQAEADKVIKLEVEKQLAEANNAVEEVNADNFVEKVNADNVVEKVNADNVVEKVNADNVVEKVNADNVVKDMAELQPAVIDINKPNSENVVEPLLKEAEASISAKEENSCAPIVVSKVLPVVPMAPLSASISSRSNKEEIKNDQIIASSNRPTMTVEEKATKCACLIL